MQFFLIFGMLAHVGIGFPFFLLQPLDLENVQASIILKRFVFNEIKTLMLEFIQYEYKLPCEAPMAYTIKQKERNWFILNHIYKIQKQTFMKIIEDFSNFIVSLIKLKFSDNNKSQRRTRMTTFIKTKGQKSADETNIHKYIVAVNITDYHIIPKLRGYGNYFM